MNVPSGQSESRSEIDDFLIQAGLLLHRYGTPAHRLERVMTQLAQSLGVEGVFLYTPTALVLSISDENGETSYLRRVEAGAVDIDKLIKFDETLEQVEAGNLSLTEASRQMESIANSAPPFPSWITILACTVSCGAVAIFFQGSIPEVATAMILGLVVALLDFAAGPLRLEKGLLEPISGLLAALIALSVSRFVIEIDDRLVTLAGLIVLIPGLPLTVALTELAVGHLSAGVARLAGACVSLLTLTIGVALGWRLAGDWRQIPEQADWPLDWWWLWVAICIAPITFAIVFRARWPQWPVIIVVSIAGFASSLFAGQYWGIEVGAFCGALAVGGGSNLYARIQDRPALVPLTPGIIVLVPGSLGYRSLTAFLDHDTMIGVDFAFNMLMVAAALVGGILTANLLVPPKRIL